MSGLAKIMKEQGYSVYGSDLEIKPVTEEMEQMGIEVFIGQKEENLIGKRIDLFVYSTAIKDTNPEYRYIVTNGIKSIKRGQLLAELMNDFEGIAVAGTHGKTTTSSMMSVAFLEKDPYIVVGGIIPEIQSNSRIGHSDIFIAEADESDNSFLFLKPKYSVVTNVEPDHLEHHGTFENIKKSFEEFIDKTEKLAVLCADSEEIRNLNIKNENVVWYSIKDENADIFAKNIRIEDGYSVYEVVKDGINIGEFRLSIPGEHNISNSLTVIYLSLELGCSLEFVKNKIYNFKGANRRYQVIYDKGIKIIDDYAHHPTEIKVTIEAAKKNEGKKVNVIFQPHRYSRTKFFLDDFVEALKLADKLILMPIYSAGEENIYDITSEKLAEMVGKDVLVCEKEEIEEIVKNNKESNEIFIFMGAGSVSKVAHDITNKL
jgi:UDP-N-acetylmuramate--alanine ligase